MEAHHNNNGLSSLEEKAGSSSKEPGGNNSLDDAVGKLLQGMYFITGVIIQIHLFKFNECRESVA